MIRQTGRMKSPPARFLPSLCCTVSAAEHKQINSLSTAVAPRPDRKVKVKSYFIRRSLLDQSRFLHFTAAGLPAGTYNVIVLEAAEPSHRRFHVCQLSLQSHQVCSITGIALPILTRWEARGTSYRPTRGPHRHTPLTSGRVPAGHVTGTAVVVSFCRGEEGGVVTVTGISLRGEGRECTETQAYTSSTAIRTMIRFRSVNSLPTLSACHACER